MNEADSPTLFPAFGALGAPTRRGSSSADATRPGGRAGDRADASRAGTPRETRKERTGTDPTGAASPVSAQSVSGQSVSGQSVPGERASGLPGFAQSVPGEAAPGEPAPGQAGGRRPGGRGRHRVTPEELVDGLNDPQREAVIHAGAPVLVVAGAGSGKTRVLTRRIAYLVGVRDVHPGSILAITFTNKAAAEMRSRVVDLVGPRARVMWVSTFHSACVRILRSEIGHFDRSTNFSIYDTVDSKRLMQMICRERELDPKRYQPRELLNWISACKNELVRPEGSASRAPRGQEELYPGVYADYQRRLRAAEAYDFDDLIMETVRLFREFPEVREKYRRRFRHVLVDEYQDTNPAQYALVRELCAPNADRDQEGLAEAGIIPMDPPELMVVGDSDQSIYAFRGATIRNILDFEKDFPGARTILLEQNYRSTQTVLSAANAVIAKNPDRPKKRLWSDAGQGEKIVGYVADTEHGEAQFVADEIDRLVDAGSTTYGQTAVFYRTNAQSRAFEDVFIRVGLPYRVVGGVRFYERKEVRDAIGYLKAIANPHDDVSVRRVINEPKRGIGDRAQELVQHFADRERISFGSALERLDEIEGLATRSASNLRAFATMMADHRTMMAEGAAADEILASILQASGYVDALRNSTDLQDESRLENLTEFVAVAEEFVAQAHVVDIDDETGRPIDPQTGTPLAADPDRDGADNVDDVPPGGPAAGSAADGDRDGDGAADDAARSRAPGELGGLGAGAPEPDDSLPAFLERIALVADADAVPEGDEEGVVTLMTLHTAKGLEFDTVFLTGFEDGVFPHMRALDDPDELEEERRLAYVGITRARKRLFLTRAVVRTQWGQPSYNPASRFIADMPEELLDWRRLIEPAATWEIRAAGRTSSARERTEGGRIFGSGQPPRGPHVDAVAVGDRVLHTSFGLGTVVDTMGTGQNAKADVDFGSLGVKRLSLRHAPMEKL
ncbi:UvrD-helicase domain-containing protein [Raineyella sp.]|nr:UvrD-helicase domain-containing protein [Raineyella sp.]MEA5155502.1 UvrD-helicase domain-containing protein [Raineyella sp.]